MFKSPSLLGDTVPDRPLNGDPFFGPQQSNTLVSDPDSLPSRYLFPLETEWEQDNNGDFFFLRRLQFPLILLQKSFCTISWLGLSCEETIHHLCPAQGYSAFQPSHSPGASSLGKGFLREKVEEKHRRQQRKEDVQ